MAADEQAYPSVWTRPERKRREQPALSRGQIVAEAMGLLDSEGMEALSMRKLGARLNAGATSMYSHVANKDELIELVVDEVYGEIEVPAATGPDDWREAARSTAHSLRSAVLRHPWIASVLGEACLAHLGPNVMRMSEEMLAVFEAGGFDLEEADDAVGAVVAYVLGMSLSEAAWLTALGRSGLDEEQWTARLLPAARAAVQPYPRLRELYAAMHDGVAAAQARGSKFDRGLEAVLSGLEAQRGV